MKRKKKQEDEPKYLTQQEATDALRKYIQNGQHGSTLFLVWELKFPLDHDENEVIIDDFIKLLTKIGIVR